MQLMKKKKKRFIRICCTWWEEMAGSAWKQILFLTNHGLSGSNSSSASLIRSVVTWGPVDDSIGRALTTWTNQVSANFPSHTAARKHSGFKSGGFFGLDPVLPLTDVLCLVAQSCPTLCDPMSCSPSGSSVHGDSPGNNTGVGCHALLQGPSQPKDWTQVSRTADRFFAIWVTLSYLYISHSSDIFF